MNKILFILLFSLCASNGFSQKNKIDPDPVLMKKYEDSLRVKADSVVRGLSYDTRQEACLKMIPLLVRALKVPGSFNYNFDSLFTVSIIYPENREFRIFTWQMLLWNTTYRYFGAIQYNEEPLRITPLIDVSMFIGNPGDTVLNADNWYGAIYYDILSKKYKKKTYYYLLGWDGNDLMSTRKVLDVMYFEEGKPIFGAPVFQKGKEGPFANRFLLEYKKDGGVSLSYDKDLEMILFDHLIPENPLTEGVFMTYIPDGTYEGFRYKKGKWYYEEKVFDLIMDAAPDFTPKPDGEKDPFMYKERGK